MAKRSGFTLVELLIVITIIALLSALGMALYAQFTKNARDAKIVSDLKFIQSALEDYHADNLTYPLTLATLTTGRVYIQQIPADPSGGAYSYIPTPLSPACNGAAIPCTSYCLSATLGTDRSDECTPSGTNNYGVTRP